MIWIAIVVGVAAGHAAMYGIIDSGGSPTPVAIYMIGLAALTVGSVFLAAETFKHDIGSDHAAEK